jgi:adenylate cyclase
MTREGFADVRKLTNEALSIDPDFTLAEALGACIRSISASQCRHEPDHIRVAVRMAREVATEARDDPTILRLAAQVIAYSAKAHEMALSAIERSFHLNPNSARNYTGSGRVNAHSGHPLVAIDHFRKALRLSSLDPGEGHRSLGYRDERPHVGTLRGRVAMRRKRCVKCTVMDRRTGS